jgi:hypothetical protein
MFPRYFFSFVSYRHPGDTASPAIQVEILTHRIRALNEHLRNNRQDKGNMRARQVLIKRYVHKQNLAFFSPEIFSALVFLQLMHFFRRKGWMKQLKNDDVNLYYAVLRDIRLRDVDADVFKFRAW